MGWSAGQSKQYGQAPIGRITIDLRKDRTNGETFPQYEGMFFYVESVDLPCRVSFNLSDDSQSVGLSSGFQLNMPFGGFTLFHDNYLLGGLTPSVPYLLTVYISREPRAFNQYVSPAVQIPLPTFEVQLGGTLQVNFPIFPRTRFFNLTSVIYVNNPADPGPFFSALEFYRADGGLLVGPSNLPKDGFVYANRGWNYPDIHDPVDASGGILWNFRLSKNGVTIPSAAARVQLVVTCEGAAPASFGFSRHYGVLI